MRTLLSFILSFLVLSTAHSCPDFLRKKNTRFLEAMDLCTVFDRYQVAKQKLVQKGISRTDRISTLLGPRFINLPDWQNQARHKKFDPHYVYEPAPKTWLNWQDAANHIDDLSEKNFSQKNAAALSLEWLLKLHQTAANGSQSTTFSELRAFPVVGKVLFQKQGITESQIKNIKNLPYVSTIDNSKRLVTWNSTQCIEALPVEIQDRYRSDYRYFNSIDFPSIDPDSYFIGTDGRQRQCGILVYSDGAEVASQIHSWLTFVNLTATGLFQTSKQDDILLSVAKIQQWFIAIHPFPYGNGRASRLIMDYFLKSLGLPAPILANMDDDMYNSPESWALQIGRGIEYAVKYAEYCSYGSNENPGCNEIKEAK